jgi:hypothetical protein
LERTRHADAVVNLEFKSKELDELKGKTTQSIVDKTAMIETKKSELRKIWEKCTELRKSESHDGEDFCFRSRIITSLVCLDTHICILATQSSRSPPGELSRLHPSM